ncbi:MAG: hypothetical protein Q8R56_11735 [Polaromonas sp.]|nr:hypothetical protein [Polaromonas sp.]
MWHLVNAAFLFAPSGPMGLGELVFAEGDKCRITIYRGHRGLKEDARNLEIFLWIFFITFIEKSIKMIKLIFYTNMRVRDLTATHPYSSAILLPAANCAGRGQHAWQKVCALWNGLNPI